MNTKVSKEMWSLKGTEYGIRGCPRTSNQNMRANAISNKIDYMSRSYIPCTVKVNSAPRLVVDNGKLYYGQPRSESSKGGYQSVISATSRRDKWRSLSRQKKNHKSSTVYDQRKITQRHRELKEKRSTIHIHADDKAAPLSAQVTRLFPDDKGTYVLDGHKNRRTPKSFDRASPHVIIGKNRSARRWRGKKKSPYSSRCAGPVPASAIIPLKMQDCSLFHTECYDRHQASSKRGWNSSLIPNKIKSDFHQETRIQYSSRECSKRNQNKRRGNRKDISGGAENVNVAVSNNKRKERRKPSSRKKRKRLREKIKRGSKTLNYIEMRNPNTELESQRTNLLKMQHQLRDEENSFRVHENTNGSNIVGDAVTGRRINNQRGAYIKKNESPLKQSSRMRSYGGVGTIEPSQMKGWFKRQEDINSPSQKRKKKEQNSFSHRPEKEPVTPRKFCTSPKGLQHHECGFLGRNTESHKKEEADRKAVSSQNKNSSKSGNSRIPSSLEGARNERKSIIVLNSGALQPLPMRQQSAGVLPLHSRRRASSKSKLLHREQQGSLSLENKTWNDNYREKENQSKVKKLSKANRGGKCIGISDWKKKPLTSDLKSKKLNRKIHRHRKNISAPPAVTEVPWGFFMSKTKNSGEVNGFKLGDHHKDFEIELSKSRGSVEYSSDYETPSKPVIGIEGRGSSIVSVHNADEYENIDLGIFDLPPKVNRTMSLHSSEFSKKRNSKDSSAIAQDWQDGGSTPLNQDEENVTGELRNQRSSSSQNQTKWSLMLSSSDSRNGTLVENDSLSQSEDKDEMINWKSCWDDEWIKLSSVEGLKLDFKQVSQDSSSNNNQTSDTDTLVYLMGHSDLQLSSKSCTQMAEAVKQRPKQNAIQVTSGGVVSRMVKSSWPSAWSQQEASEMFSEEMQPAKQQQTRTKWRIVE